jgi:signal transduction histidine kinase
VSDGDDNRKKDREDQEALVTPGLIHELRHPLAGIKGGLELVEWKLGEAVTGLEEWQLVARQVRRMEDLLCSYQGLLSPGDAVPAVFDVGEVVEQAVDLLSFRLRRLGSRFLWSTAPAPQRGRGAPNAVLHAVTNVLVNAVDAAEAADNGARVQLRVIPGNAAVEVRVSDEGTGIPPRDRARLFQPRFTTKERGKGNGLGLHIARTMMRNHGGGIHLVDEGDPERTPWARTEFSIEVPAERG